MKNSTVKKYNKEIIFTKLLVLIFMMLLMDACKTKFYKESAPGPASGGNINFTTYVAVGSTTTAGFADNALYTEAQEGAYPKLISAKIAEVNQALVFNQPDINSVNGWVSANVGRSILQIPTCSTVTISGVAQTGDPSLNSYTGTKSTLNNFAVPFITVDSINVPITTGGSKSTNPKPYFTRMTNVTTLGIASDAKKRGGTFFTIYLGDVDVLKYATSGGTKTLISQAVFQQNIDALLDSLLAVPGSKGVIANIPYVDLFPIVTVNNRRLTSASDPARNPVWLSAAAAASFNAHPAIGAGFFSVAPAPSYYAITTGAGAVRQLNPTADFVVTSSVLNKSGIGRVDSLSVRNCTADLTFRDSSGFKAPFANSAVLDKDEITFLRSQIDAYNAIIVNAVNTRNAGGVRLAVVDLNAFYTKLSDPLYGISYGTELIIRTNHPASGPDFGGFFSLDRTQPTPLGQALLANEFIKAINANFSSSLNLYTASELSGFRENVIKGH
jgi:hypothetical protein